MSQTLRDCPYCGRPCVGRTCHRHRDLPALDNLGELRRLLARELATVRRLTLGQYR